jgi:hypothetical protein
MEQLSIDLSQTYPLVYEDIYKSDQSWIYEQIRKKPSAGIDEYLTIVNYNTLDGSGTIQFHYQTVGNGFKLWHTFRIKDSTVKDQRNPTLNELRYLADHKVLLYTQKNIR